ncbi:exocyst complex component Sec15 isoform X3 [Tachypleus tridentatus]|uniref:exocyst complex component Sec15 isoform X3 n=1 Tax=Tachypleus tridentatus TaxID=6853 RepID=UPI003FD0EBD1
MSRLVTERTMAVVADCNNQNLINSQQKWAKDDTDGIRLSRLVLENQHNSDSIPSKEKDKNRFRTVNKSSDPLGTAVSNLKDCALKSEIFSEKTLENRHELYISELEGSDGLLTTGPTLRAIYDGDEHQKFMEKLDARIKNHDRDIERMCNFHYQGFIESIRELLLVRTQAQKLKNEVNVIDQELQFTVRRVIQKGEELIKYRKVQTHIASAVESLSLCLPVLEMYGKLSQHMKEKRYYPALKTLEQLEHTYLPRVSRYRFSQTMQSSIPRLREQIKEASMSELKDFLENIRKVSSKLGEVAMRHAEEQQNIEAGLIRRRKKRKAPPPPNPFTGEVELEPEADSSPYEGSEELSAQDLVDFSPVYRCLHIYSVLGARETFETYYRQQRKQQARLALQPPTNMHETVNGYRNYFSGIVGFFVVEDHILNTASGLVNRAYLEEVWENALSKILASLRNHSSYCTDADLMLKVKHLIMLFSFTLGSYGYPVGQLSDLLVELRDQYIEILMKKWVQVFREIFDDDNYQPVQVVNQAEYNHVLKDFPFHDENLEKMGFPKILPFSYFVPKVYNQVKQFIYACLKFSEDLNLSQTEAEDMVRKSTNLLLTRTLSGCLSTLIKKPHLGLQELIQITINTNYLEDASVYLEEFISDITGSGSSSLHCAKLQSKSMFKDARADAESQIYLQLNKKIDGFLELANYDWLLGEPEGHASSYLTDLIAFLQSTFQAFTNLPDKVAQTACMSSCKYIASSLVEFLMDEDVKHVSMGALQQFNLDLIQCELFANSEPVRGFEEGALQMCFADLRQFLHFICITSRTS